MIEIFLIDTNDDIIKLSKLFHLLFRSLDIWEKQERVKETN